MFYRRIGVLDGFLRTPEGWGQRRKDSLGVLVSWSRIWRVLESELERQKFIESRSHLSSLKTCLPPRFCEFNTLVWNFAAASWKTPTSLRLKPFLKLLNPKAVPQALAGFELPLDRKLALFETMSGVWNGMWFELFFFFCLPLLGVVTLSCMSYSHKYNFTVFFKAWFSTLAVTGILTPFC